MNIEYATSRVNTSKIYEFCIPVSEEIYCNLLKDTYGFFLNGRVNDFNLEKIFGDSKLEYQLYGYARALFESEENCDSDSISIDLVYPNEWFIKEHGESIDFQQKAMMVRVSVDGKTFKKYRNNL